MSMEKSRSRSKVSHSVLLSIDELKHARPIGLIIECLAPKGLSLASISVKYITTECRGDVLLMVRLIRQIQARPSISAGDR